MDGIKGLLESRTIWGIVVSVVGKAAAIGGYTITSGDEQTIVAAISLLVSAFGDIYAAYGRIKATKVIGKA